MEQAANEKFAYVCGRVVGGWHPSPDLKSRVLELLKTNDNKAEVWKWF